MLGGMNATLLWAGWEKPVSRWLGVLVIAWVAGSLGYHWRAIREQAEVFMPIHPNASLDYFLAWNSFDEVDGAKAILEASAQQFIAELRDRPVVGVFRTPDAQALAPEARARCFAQAVKAVEQEINQFKGTPQEPVLVREFLLLLKRGGLPGRWLDEYLAFLYQHPTDDLVGDWAPQAQAISRTLGRERDLQRAFEYLGANLLDGEPKRRVAQLSQPALQAGSGSGSLALHYPVEPWR